MPLSEFAQAIENEQLRAMAKAARQYRLFLDSYVGSDPHWRPVADTLERIAAKEFLTGHLWWFLSQREDNEPFRNEKHLVPSGADLREYCVIEPPRFWPCTPKLTQYEQGTRDVGKYHFGPRRLVIEQSVYGKLTCDARPAELRSCRRVFYAEGWRSNFVELSEFVLRKTLTPVG